MRLARGLSVHEAWSHAQGRRIAELAATSFADLAAIDAAISAGTYQPSP